jgi:hypothetical protein
LLRPADDLLAGDGIRATTQFLQEQIMITQTSKFDDQHLNELANNVPYSLFYTPLIGGVAVYACMWLCSQMANFSLFDDSIY